MSLTESLPLRACYSDTAISQVLWIHSEIVLLGEIKLDWSPGERVIIRYDHWETTWVCVTAFVILTAAKTSRGEKWWLKECLPSLCLWRKKYGDTRVVSKDVPWQQSGKKALVVGWTWEKRASKGGVGEMFEALPAPPSSLLLLGDIWRKCKWVGNRGTAGVYKQLHKHKRTEQCG